MERLGHGYKLDQDSVLSVDGVIIGHVKSWIANANNDAFPEKVECINCGSIMGQGVLYLQGQWICTNNDCKTRKGKSRYDLAREAIQ